MAKARKDSKGRVLHKGESYEKDRNLYRYTFTDQFGNRKSIYSKDLHELRQREKRIEKDKLDGLDIYAQGHADVNYVFDRYISTKAGHLRGTTMSNYVYTYDRYVRNGFGKKKVGDAKFSDVLLFYNALIGRGLSVNTVDSVHSVLHPTFQLAVRDDIIRNNPTDGVMAELKKKLGKSDMRHALTIEEEQAFLDFIDEPDYIRWKPLFIVMFGTGCRVGEIIGLRWKDVDFEKNEISVNHSVSYYPRSDNSFKCEYEVSEPKTEAGKRIIPMLNKVQDALKLEKENQKKYGYHNVVELGGMSGFIFCNRFGNLHNPAGINRQIKRIVDDYNCREELKAVKENREPLIIPRFSCHITRHTFCTRLCENETNVKVIQSVMGHKDIQTTLDIYAEVSEQKKQDAFKKLNDNDVI